VHRHPRPCLLPKSDLNGPLSCWKHGLSVTETSKRIDSDSSRLPDLRPDDSGSARPPVGSTQTKGRNDMSIEMNRRGLLAAGAAAAALPLLTPSAASARAAGTV